MSNKFSNGYIIKSLTDKNIIHEEFGFKSDSEARNTAHRFARKNNIENFIILSVS